jgi:hypothetical protein
MSTYTAKIGVLFYNDNREQIRGTITFKRFYKISMNFSIITITVNYCIMVYVRVLIVIIMYLIKVVLKIY